MRVVLIGQSQVSKAEGGGRFLSKPKSSASSSRERQVLMTIHSLIPQIYTVGLQEARLCYYQQVAWSLTQNRSLCRGVSFTPHSDERTRVLWCSS